MQTITLAISIVALVISAVALIAGGRTRGR